MQTLDTQALVLRVVDFGESDRIAHLLTPATSRITVIAKGARRSKRRFPGTLDLLHLLAVRIERRRPTSMARLDQARLLDAGTALRTHPARFALACYLVELVGRLAPEAAGGRDAQQLFAVVGGALRIAACRDPDLRLRALLELRVLAALGLRPELRRCVRCGRDVEIGATSGAVAFHVAEGGPLCPRCVHPADAVLPLQRGTLRALEQGLRLPFDRLDRLALGAQPTAEAHALLARFLRFHVGFELKSERFLDSFLAVERTRASA
ncbi:MAG: DNA repair protein RecO [Myxococcota bacterium]|jgi:DNA repair protein RecO (recombination protein O)|nr:DNA repair protein RecO [Myxococcota bacterium]